MKQTKLILNAEQSNVLIKVRQTVPTYLKNEIKYTQGSISILNNELEDASVEFLVGIDKNKNKIKVFPEYSSPYQSYAEDNYKTIYFKSTSFEKINPTINFLKGKLTINDVTKMVELHAVLKTVENKNGQSTACFEIFETLNKKDFGWSNQDKIRVNGNAIGQYFALTANLEFTNY
jgi:YceI-like domain